MYERPYRLEQVIGAALNTWRIVTTNDGTICEGHDFHHMRKLVDAANEAAAQQREMAAAR
jgi:hypothetical protein